MAYGFSKGNNVFLRCVGDGIIQVISLSQFPLSGHSFTKHSKFKHNRYVISIGMRSMFSDIPELQYSNLKCICEYFPENFLGIRLDSTSYQGFEYEFEIMKLKGFSFLDTVLTQKELINAVCNLDRTQFGLCIPHRIELAAPYLICDERDQALMRLYGMYAQNHLNFHMRNRPLKESGRYREYIEAEDYFEQETENLKKFLISILGNRKMEINEYLLSNLDKNIIHAKDNNIRFSDDFICNVDQVSKSLTEKASG